MALAGGSVGFGERQPRGQYLAGVEVRDARCMRGAASLRSDGDDGDGQQGRGAEFHDGLLGVLIFGPWHQGRHGQPH